MTNGRTDGQMTGANLNAPLTIVMGRNKKENKMLNIDFRPAFMRELDYVTLCQHPGNNTENITKMAGKKE